MTWVQTPKDVRDAIFARDGAICRVCGATDRLDIDHVIPTSGGGVDDLENLQVLCRRCNCRKGGGRGIDSWRMDGEKLRAARKRAALSMRDLEEASGVKLITIHRIETGKVHDAYPSTVRKLAAALGMEPAELMSETPARPAPARDEE